MKKSKVNNENHITIHGWMINELGLKGSELIIYAIIYGFSQDGQSKFTGSLQYLADWTNSTKQNCMNHLKSLLEKDLIEKEEIEINNNKYCKYNAKLNTIQNFCIGIQKNCIGIQKILPNNIYNNIENIDNNTIINNSIMEKPETPFSKLENNLEEDKPKKKKALTQKQKNAIKCKTILEDFIQFEPPAIQEALKLYVEVRKSKGLQPEQLQIILEDFRKEYKGKPTSVILEQIRKATAKGWLMLVYKDTFSGTAKVSYSNKPNFDNTSNHNIPKGVANMTKEEKEYYEEHELAKDENGNFIKF